MYLTEPTIESLNLAQAAADYLLNARSKKVLLESLPLDCRPGNNELALQIQSKVSQRLTAVGDAIGGWKSASPTEGKLIVAPIYRSAMHFLKQDNAPFKLNPALKKVLVEPELALVLNADLPPRTQPYSKEEIDACIGEVNLALEIISSRYVDPAKVTFPELLADGLLNSGLAIGPEIKLHFSAIPETIDVTIKTPQGEQKSIKGVHPEVNVMRPLYWLVDFLNRRGIGLDAGQSIITGSYAGVLALPRNEAVDIQFGDLGSIQITIV